VWQCFERFIVVRSFRSGFTADVDAEVDDGVVRKRWEDVSSCCVKVIR
jgi:hypothetical protein